MKLKTYVKLRNTVAVFLAIFVFLFFGGIRLFEHFYLVLVLCSFIAALVIFAFIKQSEKIEELENRIEKLENDRKGSD